MAKIDFKHTGISKLIRDYLAEHQNINPLYHRFPHKENYEKQAKEKLKHYKHRKTLHQVLTQQMRGLNLSTKQQENLLKLKENHAVTITTGHQLNLFTGPLYFIYKILHTIKICDELNKTSSSISYVPIYWMATEDHDFEEINHFNTYQNKFEYDAPSGGFVGETEAYLALGSLKNFMKTLPKNKFGKELENLILHIFSEKGKGLAKATQELVHALLGDFGILILDANQSELKRKMIPYFEKELKENPTQYLIQQTNQSLEKYKTQAHAREINLFYLNQNQRERIEKINDSYVLTESKKSFSQNDFFSILKEHPERFSPNVILRPLYQEVILPNVAYVGGGGEIAYWLQLKSVFEFDKIPFPMLVLRNSILLLPNAIKHKAESLGLLSEKMFLPKHQIKYNWVESHSKLFDELDLLKQDLVEKFDALDEIAKETDDNFSKMVKAQKQKQLNGYDKLYQRLIKSEQKKQENLMMKLDEVYDYIFPKNNWQERVINFSEFYKTNGSTLFNKIYDEMEPFDSSFHILNLDSILK